MSDVCLSVAYIRTKSSTEPISHVTRTPLSRSKVKVTGGAAYRGGSRTACYKCERCGIPGSSRRRDCEWQMPTGHCAIPRCRPNPDSRSDDYSAAYAADQSESDKTHVHVIGRLSANCVVPQFTVSHGSAYTVVRATQQVNGKRQFWGCQNSVTPEPIY